jgi:hypothetical protein
MIIGEGPDVIFDMNGIVTSLWHSEDCSSHVFWDSQENRLFSSDRPGLGWPTSGHAPIVVRGIRNVQPCNYNPRWWYTYDVIPGGRYGLVNGDKLVAPLEFERLHVWGNTWSSAGNIFAAKRSGRAGFIDGNGRELVPFVFEETRELRDGIAPVKFNGVWGLINY